MYKFKGIILIVSTLFVLSYADPGLLHRLRPMKGIIPIQKQPDVIVEKKEIYVIEQTPCKGDKCKSKEPEFVCKTEICRTCRNECYGNDRCQSDCIIVERCRNDCNGNDRCMNECGGGGYQNQNLCRGDKCRPKEPEFVCKTEYCRTCRNDCNGNERCHTECTVIEKCRNDCNGNDRCINDCGGNKGWNIPSWNNPWNNDDRCRGCNSGNGNGQLTFCPNGKYLYYCQIPKSIILSEFVSNPDLLQLYYESNLDLDSNGMSGRACLNDKTRLDLSKLKASLMPVNTNK